ncbi:MAG: putative transporter [Bacteroidales bacterium]|nr:putative transporter [Bacteroidales bacterium]
MGHWFNEILFGSSVAHAVFALALTIAVGLSLGKFKIAGISLGITWILFAGIFFSHFGIRLTPAVGHFVKEFGLILFVYAIGLQVGPSFFSSLRKGGLSMNLMAAAIVLLGCLTTYAIHVLSGTDLVTMVGIMSGAVTNTPGLGAAQQTYSDATGLSGQTIASGYAAAYPLGVVGIILSIMVFKYIGNRHNAEAENFVPGKSESETRRINLRVANQGIFGQSIAEMARIVNRPFVISRVMHPDGTIEAGLGELKLHEGDVLRIVARPEAVEALTAYIGQVVHIDAAVWEKETSELVSRRIVVTKEQVNGSRIGDLHLRSLHDVTITRVNRAGLDLLATMDLRLQLGDRVTVVGKKESVEKIATILGNSMKRLDVPNLFPIFFGVLLGVLLGSVPVMFPGVPMPVKLGLAGGPLVVAILIGRFGPYYHMVTFTTTSANMMLREIGIALFLAAVGLDAGEHFVETLATGGYRWIFYGVLITVLPLLIVGFIGRKCFKWDYYKMAGLMAGATTDPPALAFVNNAAPNDRAAVSYATVYPLTMFLRILAAQVLVLLAL